jgi:thiol:disulfide interchange protein
MKYVFLTIILIFGLLFLQASIEERNAIDNNNGIQFFTGTWQEALDLAKKEDKLIFLDAYASWCRPCKMMKRRTFTDEQVGDYFNKNFINLAIDMELGEGKVLARKYNVQSYPTLYFIESNENPLIAAVGFHNAEKLINLGKEALKRKK